MNISIKISPMRKKISVLVAIVVIFSTLIAPASTLLTYAQSSPPVPISPSDGSVASVVNYPPLAIPEFVWGNVPGATLYRLQISGDIGFANIAFEVNTPNTTFTPNNMSSTLFADGDWYWRVRVESPSPPGDYSFPVMFTKNWASIENSSQLYFPINNGVIDFYETPVFSWSRVSGAARYRFQIAATPDSFNQPLYSKDTLAVSHQPPTKLANGIYYWRVVPIDPANHEGTESEIRTFTLNYGSTVFNQVPVQISPENNSYPTFTPTFSWTAIKGASHYRMEYTSDPECTFQTNVIPVVTRNTSYTPTTTFSNDINYCWRVRAESGQSIGEWSPIWIFQKQWYLKPVLLAPTNNYKYGLYPLYQWTPVPGASHYLIQIDTNDDFVNLFDSATTANTYFTMGNYIGSPYTPYYWRVRPIDGSNHDGIWSDVDSFQSYYTSTAPVQFYPFYYYLPNDPAQYGEFDLNPARDLTAPFPLFMWSRTTNPTPVGGTFADAYRVQVSTTPYFGADTVWDFDTENTSAVPTLTDNFTPMVDQDYYWRVCPLNAIQGDCLTNPDNGDLWWSQIWKARIDTSLMLPPTQGGSPQLIRPVQGDEFVEATPLLEWWPYDNADYYQVQISRDENFTNNEVQVSVPYPAYSPQHSIAQRTLDRLDYGTFYWRVRADVGGVWTGWSDAWRFQIASQSEWATNRSIGSPYNLLQIGDDPDDAVDNYELTNINVVQSEGSWWFGFNAITSTTDMSYVVYLDLDQEDGSGATFPPSDRPYTVSTIPAHQPEFAIFVDQTGSTFSADKTYIYPWQGTDWGFYEKLQDISGAEISYNAGYIELKIPDTAIDMASENRSGIALMVFSVDTSTGVLQDSVPSDPAVPGSGLLSRFTSVSENMNLIFPPDHSAGDPRTYSMMMPFFWDFPTGSDPVGDPPATAPWKGSELELHLDPGYTNRVGFITSTSSDPYFSYPHNTFFNDVQGDNTYYWRARPRYSNNSYGSWNDGGNFEIVEFIPQNLQTSVTFATPTFSWDMVEGASTYDLQVATDPSFGSGIVINVRTPLTSYIPLNTLANDDYFWRVRIRRYGGDIIKTDWSEVQNFTLSLPKPSNLTPDNSIVNYAPTFCWDHILEEDPNTGYPVLTAWKYRLQVSKDPTFSLIYEQIDTEQTCYTPSKGYDDGSYYWRVAMIDGNNRLGDYSASAQFTKQYPITELISPVDENVASTPTFIWTPVDGAARYRLEISQYSTFSPLYDSATTVNTRYTPVKLYELDRPYYWRVAMIDSDGRYGPYNDATIIIGTFNPGIYLPLIVKNQ